MGVNCGELILERELPLKVECAKMGHCVLDYFLTCLFSKKKKVKEKKKKNKWKNEVDLVFLYLTVNQNPRILALITDSDIPYVRCITWHIKKVSIYEKLLAKIFHFRCDFQQKKNWQLKNLRKIKSILPITSALLTPKKKLHLT